VVFIYAERYHGNDRKVYKSCELPIHQHLIFEFVYRCLLLARQPSRMTLIALENQNDVKFAKPVEAVTICFHETFTNVRGRKAP